MQRVQRRSDRQAWPGRTRGDRQLIGGAAGFSGAALALGGLGWFGLRVPPRTEGPVGGAGREVGTVALPDDLPAPIARHFRATLGERPPRVETAVTWGTARMRVGGVWLPARVATSYVAGWRFARRVEITWFGLPLLRGFDTYADGVGALTIGGSTPRGPGTAARSRAWNTTSPWTA